MAQPSQQSGERTRATALCLILNTAFEIRGEAEVADGAYTGRLILPEASALRLIAERERYGRAEPEILDQAVHAERMRSAGAVRFVRQSWGAA
jgi:hypothetical protein